MWLCSVLQYHTVKLLSFICRSDSTKRQILKWLISLPSQPFKLLSDYMHFAPVKLLLALSKFYYVYDSNEIRGGVSCFLKLFGIMDWNLIA